MAGDGAWHELVRDNISRHGHHITLVQGGLAPRFAYTVGLTPLRSVELVLAGACWFSAAEVGVILNSLAARLGERAEDISGVRLEVPSLGTFTLRNVHASWSSSLLLGAADLFGADAVTGLQVVPDQQHWTVDVPDMSAPWSPTVEPVWRWLHEPWPYPVPEQSLTTTNLDALRGGQVTEVTRWEDEYWEMFAGAGPDVAPGDVRVVPLAMLVAADESLNAVTRLEVGQGLWRHPGESEWHPWTTTT